MPPKPMRTIHIKRASSSDELFPEDLMLNLTPVFNKHLLRVKGNPDTLPPMELAIIVTKTVKPPAKPSPLRAVSPVAEESKVGTPPIEKEVEVKRKWCCF